MKCVRAILAGLAIVSGAAAQEGNLSASLPAWNGMEIRFVTKMEPPGVTLPGGVVVESGKVHRVIQDRAHRTAMGYDVEVDPAGDGKSARVRILRLQPSDEQMLFDPGTALVDLPKYPVIEGVKVGDTVALDLLVNGAGQKIVDYLTLRRRGETVVTRAPRDFQLIDVELALMEPKVLVNGKAEPENGMQGMSGPIVWVYVPGHGRFVLSLLSHESFGFVKNGLVSGDGLVFHDGGAEIRVECRGRVAPGDGVYNLYAVHQPGWRLPPGLGTIGAADKPEYVLGRK